MPAPRSNATARYIANCTDGVAEAEQHYRQSSLEGELRELGAVAAHGGPDGRLAPALSLGISDCAFASQDTIAS